MQIRIILLTLIMLSANHLRAQATIDVRADGKSYLRGRTPKIPAGVREYDPDMLIPHYDPETRRYGYLRRGTLELVVPHRFYQAGRFLNGCAYAIEQPQDSLMEHVFRIDSKAQQVCIFRDTSTVEPFEEYGVLRTQRYTHLETDGYLRILRRDWLTMLAPDGRQLYHFQIPCHYFDVRYGHAGKVFFTNDSTVTFIDSAGKIATSYDLRSYRLGEWVHTGSLATSRELFAPIERLSDHKMGILGSSGKLIVPFLWDTASSWVNGQQVARPESHAQWSEPCSPTGDSLFFGWRDGYAHLVHLDGRVLYQFRKDQIPYGFREVAWRKHGLVFTLLSDEQGRIYSMALVERGSGQPEFKADDVSILSDSLVVQYFRDRGLRRHSFIRNVNHTGLVRMDAYRRYPNLLILKSFDYQGHRYHRVCDRDTQREGIMDDKGKMMIPLKKWQVVTDFDSAIYPEILLAWRTERQAKAKNGGGRSIHQFIQHRTPTGEMLFEERVDILVPAKGEAKQGEADSDPSNLGFGFGLMNNLEGLARSSTPYCNQLWTGKPRKIKGIEYRGYVDAYGQRYY